MPSRGNVAIPLTDGFDDDEFETVRERLREAGYGVHVIGASAATELVARDHHTRVRVDRAASEVRPRDYVGVVLVDAGPYGLVDIPGVPAFIHAFDRFERPVLVFKANASLLPPPSEGAPVSHRIRCTAPSNLEQACWAFVDRLENGFAARSTPAAHDRAVEAHGERMPGMGPLHRDGSGIEFPWNVL